MTDMADVFTSYCRSLETRLSDADSKEAVKIVSEEIKRVLADPSFLLPFLEEMAEGKILGELRAADYNDITLYRSQGNLFSVRLFVWEAFTPYPIHDHGSWGVVGCLSGRIALTQYNRTDSGQDVNKAVLEERTKIVMSPGDTTIVLPLDKGIHHMEAFGGKTAISLHTYGKPVRKGYIRGFNPDNHSTYRIYAPKYLSRIIALKALSSLDSSKTTETAERFVREGNPVLTEEARLILQARKESDA